MYPSRIGRGRHRAAAVWRANTWLIVAVLALGGWTVDALRMVLGMHETGWPGIATVMAHFWYVVPMTVVLLGLAYLQRPAKVLSVVLYAADGRVLYCQGQLDHDDLATSNPRRALSGECRQGLHSRALPSGNYVYFVRAGSRTLALCFSGPATARAVTDGAASRREDIQTPDLLAGLEPPVAALATSLMAAPGKRSILRFFHEHQNLAVEPADLAYRLGQDQAVVARTLDELTGQGLLVRQTACDRVFYRVRRTPESMALLDAVFRWRTKWLAHAENLERMIA